MAPHPGPPDTVEDGCLIKRARLGHHVDSRVLLGEFGQITLVVSGFGARSKSLRKTVFGVVSCTPNRRGHQSLFLHKFFLQKILICFFAGFKVNNLGLILKIVKNNLSCVYILV